MERRSSGRSRLRSRDGGREAPPDPERRPDARTFAASHRFDPGQGHGWRQDVCFALSRHGVLHVLEARFSPGCRRDRRLGARRLDASLCATTSHPGRTVALRRRRQRHARARRRHSRPACAGAVPRALDQSRHRRGEGAGATSQRQGAARPLPHCARIGGGLRAELGGFRRPGQDLRPAGRARPHRHHPQGDPQPSARIAWSFSTAATPGRTATPR